MILEKLIVENFCLFRGRNELVFASDRESDMTLISGGNGAGKTTLIRALHWGLFGTDDFGVGPRLLHESSRPSDGSKAVVEITFRAAETRCIARRTLSRDQQVSRNSDLVVQ